MLLSFKTNVDASNGQYTDIDADGAYIGTLFTCMDEMHWLASYTQNAGPQLRELDEEDFLEIVNHLKERKEVEGCKRLSISSINGGIVSIIDENLLKKAGFCNIEGMSPSFMYVE